MTPGEAALRAALQLLLDEEGDGWTPTQHVVCVGLERISADGQIEAGSWAWAPPSQPEWMTTGLLEEVINSRAGADDD